MILLQMSVLILTFLVSKAFPEILHCYECDDCNASNITLFQKCPHTQTTTTLDNSLPDTTTIPSTTSTTSTMISTTEPSAITDVTVSALESTPTFTSVSSTTGAEINDDDTDKVRKRSVRHVNYRALMIRRFAREIDVSHHCYTIEGYGGNPKKIKKGCVKVIGNKNACDVINEHYDAPVGKCEVCRESKCNNSGAVRNRHSISYPVMGLLIVFYLFCL